MVDSPEHRAGFVALVGRPNTGKSSLINRILERKISIVTPRPQTTRHRILGILTAAEHQIAFVDTPGLHQGHRRGLNRMLNRTAAASLEEADVLVLVIEADRWTEEDESVLRRAVTSGLPMVLAMNKVDRVQPKDRLLPLIAEHGARAEFVDIVPTSANKGHNIEVLVAAARGLLPVSPPLFPEDQITDRSETFQVAERIREQLLFRLNEELPYGVTVGIERMENKGDVRHINALIVVEREAHKPIVIGRGGELLRDVGIHARKGIEELLQQRVHLETWVKVREAWPDDERALREFGYEQG